MIIAQYTTFRQYFAIRGFSGVISVTFAPGPPATITRAAGSFITNGFQNGHSVDIFGSSSNNKRVLVASVSPLVLTLDADETLNAAGSEPASLVGSFYENDGMEQWPITKVRAGGFTALSIPRPITGSPVNITCNGGLTDAADGTSYNWFVSQRTEDPTKKLWLETQPDATKSGSIRLQLTSVGTDELGLGAVGNMTLDRQIRGLRKVIVYVQRASDRAIQLADLYIASNTELTV